MGWQLPIGAQPDGNGVRFRVWAASVEAVQVVIFDEQGRETASYDLQRDQDGYFLSSVEGLGPGTRYMYRLGANILRPDPASRYQPVDIHGQSQVVSPDFDWHDQDWCGLPIEEMSIYEVHIGTATLSGTFDGFIDKLDYVKSLGVSAIEIMPVSDWPGTRNWGYDGVDLYAPSHIYGGPEAFKRLVDAAHAHGLAVLLDVVYNHFGPDGNYLRDFSQEYFTHAKKSPWGDALNFGHPAVREFFISNALYWAQEYHLDGLRLDATPWIVDESQPHILKEIVQKVHESLPEGRQFVMVAEDDRNLAEMLEPLDKGGYGFDATWADDFHHHVRRALAGDNEGYFVDYTGTATDLADTLAKGWFFVGQLSRHAGRERGSLAAHIDPPHFVYCIQNHDQIGNRAVGDRLNFTVAPEAYRAASALLLLSPYTPLLFQGQEWAASTPFMYFTDHNEELGRLVTQGRREEFSHFSSFSSEEVPDPQALATFEQSRLKWDELDGPDHAPVLKLYRDLLALRRDKLIRDYRTRQAFSSMVVDQDALALRYAAPNGEDLLVIVNLESDLNLNLAEPDITRLPDGWRWQPLLTTNDRQYGGQASLDDFAGPVLKASGAIGLLLQAVKTRD